MTKQEILNAINEVAERLQNDMNTTESPMIYLKDDVRRKVYLEVADFLVNAIEEPQIPVIKEPIKKEPATKA